MNLKDKAKELLVNTIGEDVNICTRVWEAWQVGTMTEEDFVLANEDEDFLNDLLDTVSKIVALACEEQKKICAGSALLEVYQEGKSGEEIDNLVVDSDIEEGYYYGKDEHVKVNEDSILNSPTVKFD